MEEKRYYATGRRKTAVARVWMIPGEGGSITVNDRSVEEYFGRPALIKLIQQPLELTNALSRYSVKATVRGGGISSQAGAIRHGLGRILAELFPDYRQTLKRLGLLTRDPRMKERKKYGQPGARKKFQWTKR